MGSSNDLETVCQGCGQLSACSRTMSCQVNSHVEHADHGMIICRAAESDVKLRMRAFAVSLVMSMSCQQAQMGLIYIA